MEAQQQLSEDTTSFLKSQLADARTKMEEQEAKVAAFKAKHLGELPSQLESNVQILAGIQAQMQSAEQALDSARQQKLYMESLLRQYQSRASLDSGSSGNAGVTGDSDNNKWHVHRERVTGLTSSPSRPAVALYRKPSRCHCTKGQDSENGKNAEKPIEDEKCR